MNSGAPEGYAVLTPLVTPFVLLLLKCKTIKRKDR